MRMKTLSATTLTLLSLGFLMPLQADTTPTWRGQSLTELAASEDDALDWQIVNDGVMGGLSKGQIEFTDEGVMRFTGTLSLENNGGFSMVQSEKVDYNLSNDLGLLLRVKGDGRTYQARLESDARFRNWPVSFIGEFTTTKGEWQQVKIPFTDFEGGWRGRSLPDKELDPSQIYRVSILLGDKKPGPFELEIDWIRTYGKGQGNFTERKAAAPDTKTAASDSPQRLIATAEADERLSTFKQALDAAGLTPFFQWDNPLTVFAPSNEAFAKLPEGTLERLLQTENKQQLVALLSYHVAAGNHPAANALSAGTVDPVKGPALSFEQTDGEVRIDGQAKVIEADVKCIDGIIHVIDTVMMPPNL